MAATAATAATDDVNDKVDRYGYTRRQRAGVSKYHEVFKTLDRLVQEYGEDFYDETPLRVHPESRLFLYHVFYRLAYRMSNYRAGDSSDPESHNRIFRIGPDGQYVPSSLLSSVHAETTESAFLDESASSPPNVVEDENREDGTVTTVTEAASILTVMAIPSGEGGTVKESTADGSKL